jgi:sugar O-acyltransferase, sialic acid O-acetyltransferase NeuD family
MSEHDYESIKDRTYLIGASGHAKVIADILESNKRSVTSVFDKDPLIKKLLHFDVAIQPADNWPQDGYYLICIGQNEIRKKVAASIPDNLLFTTAVHPSANVSQYATIGVGTAVMAGATINVGVTIGKHVIINTCCSVDHECSIGDFVHISPNAALAGNVSIGEGTHVGIGACVIQGIKIGKWCTVGAGAVIIHDVPDGSTVVGNPGRVIKRKQIID